MTDDPAPPSEAAGVRAQRRARRETRIVRRERCFNLMTSGYSLSQIAKMVQASAATVRREIDQALAERRLDAPERFAQVQVARLMKALRLAEAAIELGEMKAVATYLRVVAALDRYHELAAGPVDSDVRCNPVDSIGPSTESRVSHSEPRLLLGFQGTKTARREGKSSPFSDAGCCTSRQNSGPPPRRVDKPPPLALPTPPKALTFSGPPDHEPSTVDELRSGSADEVLR